jgi:hypothetical protein
VATYHFSAKPIKRSAGRSAVGAAAYRAGVEITDERTGVVHDYTRKGGVLHSEIILPGGGTADRAEFWNGIESHHKRGDAVLAREVEVSLPAELTAEQRQELAVGYARELADRYGVAADVALHAPRKITLRDLEKNPNQYHERDAIGLRHNGNWHAHIMLSACSVQPDGTLGKKAVELDPIHCQKHRIENMADRERARWGELANAALERHGHQARIDHRSHAERGIEAEPTRHLGPAGAAIERRTGESSRRRQAFDQDIGDRLNKAKELGQLERERDELKASIIDLSGDLAAAKAERTRLITLAVAEAQKQAVEASRASVDTRYVQSLENVTSETLATVPGIIPAKAVEYAIGAIYSEEKAKVDPLRDVDLYQVHKQVIAQPSNQRRLAQADQWEAEAKAAMQEIASMGPIKRRFYDIKGATETAEKLQHKAKLERAQVGNAADLSPEVQQAKQSHERNNQVRRQFQAIEDGLNEILKRVRAGESIWKQPRHIYLLPELVGRVVEKARALVKHALKEMQPEAVEKATAKAVDVAWKAPTSQREFDVRVSRFVLPAVERRQQQEREQAQEKQHGHGMSR